GRRGEHRAQRARGEDVARRDERVFRIEHLHTELRGALAINVRDRNGRTLSEQERDEMRAHVTRALHHDATIGERTRTPYEFANRPHRVQDADRGHWRWITGPTAARIDARDPRRLQRDAVHIGLRGVHIFRGDVATAELVYGPAERASKRLRARCPRIVEHH